MLICVSLHASVAWHLDLCWYLTEKEPLTLRPPLPSRFTAAARADRAAILQLALFRPSTPHTVPWHRHHDGARKHETQEEGWARGLSRRQESVQIHLACLCPHRREEAASSNCHSPPDAWQVVVRHLGSKCRLAEEAASPMRREEGGTACVDPKGCALESDERWTDRRVENSGEGGFRDCPAAED